MILVYWLRSSAAKKKVDRRGLVVFRDRKISCIFGNRPDYLIPSAWRCFIVLACAMDDSGLFLILFLFFSIFILVLSSCHYLTKLVSYVQTEALPRYCKKSCRISCKMSVFIFFIYEHEQRRSIMSLCYLRGKYFTEIPDYADFTCWVCYPSASKDLFPGLLRKIWTLEEIKQQNPTLFISVIYFFHFFSFLFAALKKCNDEGRGSCWTWPLHCRENTGVQMMYDAGNECGEGRRHGYWKRQAEVNLTRLLKLWLCMW